MFCSTDLLNQYRSALQNRDKVAKDRDDHLNTMKSPEMMKTQQEMEEKKKQLEEIERQLGMFADLGVRIDFKLFILSAFLISVCSTSSVNTSKTSETGSCGCW